MMNQTAVVARGIVLLSWLGAVGLVWVGSQTAWGDPPAGYYDSVDTSSAAALRVTLHDVIDDHTRFPYTDTDTDTWDIIELADEDPNNANNVLTIYRNRSQAKSDHWNSNNTTGWSREHSWAKTYGFTRDGRCNYPYTDVHHLFASNNDYNSARSNLLFNWVPSPDLSFPVDNSPFSNYCVNCDQFQDGDWEVWPDRQGDIARAQLYMDVRYEGDTHSITGCSEPDLILSNDRVVDWSARKNFSPAFMAFLDVLIQWHNDDPPDAGEMARNDVVFSFQGNRNPFIDHPEWVGIIWGGGSTCGTNAECDDGNPCTVDTCSAGSCSNTQIDCDDGDACTADGCDSGTGLCLNDPISCDDGDVCSADSCDSGLGCVNSFPECGLVDGCCGADCDTSNDPDCCVASGDPCAQDGDCCSNNCRAGRCRGG